MLNNPEYEPINVAKREDYVLEVYKAIDLLRTPAPLRQWLVEPWLPDNALLMLSGDGGIGKSTIGLQLCVSTTAMCLWLDFDVRPGPALYVSCEDDLAEVHFRLEKLMAANKQTAPANLYIVSLAGKDALLAKPYNGRMTATPLLYQLENVIKDNGIRLVVLDALADVYGGNEIDRAQVRGFCQLLSGVAIRQSCAILLLSHPSVDAMRSGRGYSGSTAWSNSVRGRLYLSKALASDDSEPDPDVRVLELSKTNRGKPGDRRLVRWHDGAFVLDGMHEDTIERMSKALKAEEVFLELIDSYNAQGRYVSPKHSNAYAPTVFSKDPIAKGIGRKALEKAMNILFANEKIKIELVGPPSRRSQHIVRVE